MAPENKRKAELKMALGESLEKTFELLDQQVATEAGAYDDLILQKARFNSAKNDLHRGVVTQEESNISFARIRAALLHLIDHLNPSDLKPLAASNDIKEEGAESLFYQSGDQVVALDLYDLEQHGLKRQAELLLRKLNKLRERYLLIQGTDVAKEFVLEEQIAQAEEQLDQIKVQLGS